MKCSILVRVLFGVMLFGIIPKSLLAVPLPPAPNPGFRALRPDHVKTWYIFSDLNTQHTNVNGILDPGDTLIASFKNWWTPVSAHTQHNYDDGPYGPYNHYFRATDPTEDMPSGPMNYASTTTPGAENFWLPREKNAVQFYMSHSQYDNNDFSTFDDGLTGDPKTILQQRNMYRNGWSLGWLTHDITEEYGVYSNDQTVAGKVRMDVFVHDGWDHDDSDGYISDPQVSMSNDIDQNARDLFTSGGQWQPPDYDDTKVMGNVDNGYTWALNQLRFQGNGHNEPTFDNTVGSMEVFETDPYALGASDVIIPDKRPDEIYNNEVDGNGNQYTYDDAVLQRNPADHNEGAPYAVDTSDGGVVSGLSGYEFYDPNDPDKVLDWGEQQVIRIDFDPSVFEAYDAEGNSDGGDITKVIFWDFGILPGATQVSPIKIELDLADLALFPDHRFYIAAVIPEPATLSLLIFGSAAFLLRRRGRKSR